MIPVLEDLHVPPTFSKMFFVLCLPKIIKVMGIDQIGPSKTGCAGTLQTTSSPFSTVVYVCTIIIMCMHDVIWSVFKYAHMSSFQPPPPPV